MNQKGAIQKVFGKDVEVIFSAEEIQSRIKELALQIEQDYPDGDVDVIGVLKGSFLFMGDLVRALNIPVRCDFMRVASYKNDRSTGNVRMEFDVTQPIEGQNVLLVEDIVDTGTTLRYLLSHIKNNKPNSVRVASLLYKETGNGMRDFVDYTAFECPDRYVIGYGLDSSGLYRSLPYVGAFL